MSHLSTFLAVMQSLAVVLILSACGGMQSAPASQSSLGAPVLTNNSNTSDTSPETPPPTTTEPGPLAPPTPPPPTVLTPVNVPIAPICSADATTNNDGVTFNDSDTLAITLTPAGQSSPNCTITNGVRDTLISTSRIDVASIYQECLAQGTVQDGITYSINILGTQNGNQRYLSFPSYDPFYYPPSQSDSWLTVQHSNSHYIIKSTAGRDPTVSIAAVFPVPFAESIADNGTTTSGHVLSVAILVDSNNGPVGCLNGSPLVIQGHANARPIELTAPTQGVFFDLFGENAWPTAHMKKQISWFTPGSRADNYFLVMPNAQGEVLGIDQLFGNNTMGPDGRFAENGYAALAKYDASKSGLISNADPVFSQLKLWHDLNGDGIAQTNELLPLSALEIQTIDLKYDGSFVERDQYGNETRMRSFVDTLKGKLVMFDLWFAFKP